MKTDELIQTLAKDARPIKRLAHPAWRAASWMAISLAYVGVVLWLVGLRPDLAAKFSDWRFVVEVGAALLTSMMAAAAAFCAGCPGRPVWERFAPLPFLAVWLASLGEGCWRQWQQVGPDGFHFRFDLTCFESITTVGLLPAIIILLMIKRGAPIAPMSTTGLAILAATALAAATLRLFHTQDVSLMLLVWQFGSVALLAAIGFLAGGFVLRWTKPNLSVAPNYGCIQQ